MVQEEPKAPNLAQSDVSKPVLGEIGAAIRAAILQTCKAHPLWQKLQERREAGEIDREDFGYEQVREVFEECRPVERNDVGRRPVVLSVTDVEQFHVFSFVDKEGAEQQIFSEDVNGVLILLPEDFGNLPDASTSSSPA